MNLHGPFLGTEAIAAGLVTKRTLHGTKWLNSSLPAELIRGEACANGILAHRAALNDDETHGFGCGAWVKSTVVDGNHPVARSRRYRLSGSPKFANTEVSRKATTWDTPPGLMSSTCSWNGRWRLPLRMYIAAAG